MPETTRARYIPIWSSEPLIDGDSVARPNAGSWDGGWPQTMGDFERFVEAFQDRLVRYAFRRLGNLNDAEDVAQDVFVRVYVDREKRKTVANVRAYVYRMASNRCTDHLRKRQNRIISLEELDAREVPLDGPRGPYMVNAREELRRVENLLNHIPPKQAEVVRLRVLDELSPPEIAGILGSPVTAVKSRLRHGLEKLREIILRAGGITS